jgi:hypothetical protein
MTRHKPVKRLSRFPYRGRLTAIPHEVAAPLPHRRPFNTSDAAFLSRVTYQGAGLGGGLGNGLDKAGE